MDMTTTAAPALADLPAQVVYKYLTNLSNYNLFKQKLACFPAERVPTRRSLIDPAR
ncbi:MAG: hypothetical protein ACRETW_08895 [Stenotrophobium sp.]